MLQLGERAVNTWNKWSHSWSPKEIQIKMTYILFPVELTNIFKDGNSTAGKCVADICIVVDPCPWESSLIKKWIRCLCSVSSLLKSVLRTPSWKGGLGIWQIEVLPFTVWSKAGIIDRVLGGETYSICSVLCFPNVLLWAWPGNKFEALFENEISSKLLLKAAKALTHLAMPYLYSLFS